MPANRYRPFAAPLHGRLIRPSNLRLVLVLVTARWAGAQPTTSSDNDGYEDFSAANFNPSLAIIIIVIISAFFFAGFFSVYLRRRSSGFPSVAAISVGGGVARRAAPRGLDPEVVAAFPTLVYSEVKRLKVGKETLECAVCLCEFGDDELLTMLPGCSHAFHPDCIGTWLESHVTCPVCRCNLAAPPDPPPEQCMDQPPGTEEVAVDVAAAEEAAELARIGSQKRSARLARSKTTGHGIIVTRTTVLDEGQLDRYTLRLPENAKKEVEEAAKLRRVASCATEFPREESSRAGYRRASSLRLASTASAFFLRTFSTKEGSTRGGGGGGGGGGLRSCFNGNGEATPEEEGEEEQSMTAPFARV